MNKKAILITVISALALLLLVYLVLSTKLVTVKPNMANNSAGISKETKRAPVDPKKLEESYKSYVKTAIREFESLLEPYLKTDDAIEQADTDSLASPARTIKADDKDTHISDLSKLKIGLMDVIVPHGFQDLHIELVKLFTNARVFLEGQNESVKNDNLALLEKIKIDYPWVSE